MPVHMAAATTVLLLFLLPLQTALCAQQQPPPPPHAPPYLVDGSWLGKPLNSIGAQSTAGTASQRPGTARMTQRDQRDEMAGS